MEAELKSQLNEDLKQALRTGDKLKLSVIRAVLAAIEKAESDRQKKLVDDAAARGASAAARGSSILSDGKLDENALRPIAAAVLNTGDAGAIGEAIARTTSAIAAILHEVEVEGKKVPDQKELAKQASLASINSSEVAKQASLQNPDVLDVIAKQAKQREESIAAYKQANRPDLAALEEAELGILKTYLPQAAGHDDIVAVVKQAIIDVGAQGQKDKGKVMQKAIAQLKGRADGRAINEVVTELLK